MAGRGSKKGHHKVLPWRSDDRVLSRMERVERLHLTGWTQQRIADHLGASLATIKRDIKRLSELWRERVQSTQEDIRGRIVAGLEQVAVKAFEAAEFDEKCERAVLFGDAVEIASETKSVHRDDNGAASFKGNKVGALGLARQAIMDQAKILGVVVDKIAPTDPHGNGLDLASLAALAREERARRESAAPAH